LLSIEGRSCNLGIEILIAIFGVALAFIVVVFVVVLVMVLVAVWLFDLSAVAFGFGAEEKDSLGLQWGKFCPELVTQYTAAYVKGLTASPLSGRLLSPELH
jgi:hypothetical protein